jgi:hypothetical protein
MNTFAPKTAIEASRLIRSTEAAAKLDACIFWNGDNTCTLDSWKMGEAGKKVKSRYELDLTAQTCTCPDFEKNGLFCKHLIYAGAVSVQAIIEEQQEALLAQMDADAANAEGVYPY